MPDSFCKIFLMVLVMLELLYAAMNAQTVSFRGQVVDEVGAVIPGATVTLTPAKGGQPRVISAGATGEFSSPNPPAGVYTLSVEYAGFEKYIQSDLRLPLVRR
jgi:hypothetical protein